MSSPKKDWNPRLVVFACNWCSYAGADTAGVSRIQHQPHFRMIRVMCSGRIQPGFVLRAFEKGADGVLVFLAASLSSVIDSYSAFVDMLRRLPATGLGPRSRT